VGLSFFLGLIFAVAIGICLGVYLLTHTFEEILGLLAYLGLIVGAIAVIVLLFVWLGSDSEVLWPVLGGILIYRVANYLRNQKAASYSKNQGTTYEKEEFSFKQIIKNVKDNLKMTPLWIYLIPITILLVIIGSLILYR